MHSVHLNKFRETHKETVIYIHTYQIALPSLAGAVEGGGQVRAVGAVGRCGRCGRWGGLEGGGQVRTGKTLLFMAGRWRGGGQVRWGRCGR